MAFSVAARREHGKGHAPTGGRVLVAGAVAPALPEADPWAIFPHPEREMRE
jgi:hypothetical protein